MCTTATDPDALESVSHDYWAPVAQLLKTVHPGAHAPQQEKPLRWEDCTLQLGRSPCLLQLEKACEQRWRRVQPEKKKLEPACLYTHKRWKTRVNLKNIDIFDILIDSSHACGKFTFIQVFSWASQLKFSCHRSCPGLQVYNRVATTEPVRRVQTVLTTQGTTSGMNHFF